MGYRFDMTPRAGTLADYADSVRLVKVDETKLEALPGQTFVPRFRKAAKRCLSHAFDVIGNRTASFIGLKPK